MKLGRHNLFVRSSGTQRTVVGIFGSQASEPICLLHTRKATIERSVDGMKQVRGTEVAMFGKRHSLWFESPTNAEQKHEFQRDSKQHTVYERPTICRCASPHFSTESDCCRLYADPRYQFHGPRNSRLSANSGFDGLTVWRLTAQASMREGRGSETISPNFAADCVWAVSGNFTSTDLANDRNLNPGCMRCRGG